MKIAVLSDIHSNVFALKAVIKDIQDHHVDLIVNLGDTFYGPIAPRDTYDTLVNLDVESICGNQDRQICDAVLNQSDLNPTMEFVINDLGSDPIEWIHSLPFDKQLGGDVYMCHGSPGCDLDYFLEDINQAFPRVRPDKEIVSFLKNRSHPLILCGHTHISRAVMAGTGQLIVNPGSVGLPAYTDNIPADHAMESYNPNASYAIVKTVKMDGLSNTLMFPIRTNWQQKRLLQGTGKTGSSS